MSAILGILSMLGFVAGVVWLIVQLIKKSKPGQPIIMMACCFVAFVASIIMTPSTSASTLSGGANATIPREDKETFIKSTQEFNYEDIARNPRDYIDERARFTGKVIQVMESGDYVELRVSVTEDEYGFWTDTIYVEYERKSKDESRILEEDIVTLYGTLNGLKTYTALLGNEVSIPKIRAEYIEIA